IPLPRGTLGFFSSFYYVQNNYHVNDNKLTHPDRQKNSLLTGISYGLPVIRKYLDVGATVKWAMADFREGSLVYDSAYASISQRYFTGMLFDLGALAKFDLSYLPGILFYYMPKVSFGASIKNIQTKFGLTYELLGVDPEVRLGGS